jgi:hypothetical protein
VQVLDRDAIVAHIGLGGRDQSGFAALVVDDGVAHADQIVDAEAELVLLTRRQQRQSAVADKSAIAK